MLDKIRKVCLRRSFLREERVRSFCSWSETERVLVLFKSDYQEKNTEVKNFISQIRSEGKQVVAIGYVDKKWAVTASLEWFVMLDRSSVSLLGRPKEEKIASKTADPYDVVIDLTGNPCIPLQYILLQTRYRIRCGKNDYARNNIYDLSISLPPQQQQEASVADGVLYYSEEKELGGEILKYLKMIKSK